MRGDGTLFRRGRFWHYAIWIDGRVVQGSTGEEDGERAARVLQRKREDLRRGEAAAHEDRVRLADLRTWLEEDYTAKKNRSLATALSAFKHVTAFFGEREKAVRIGAGIERYVAARRAEEAAESSIRSELALLNRAFGLAVKKRRLSAHKRPVIELPPEDLSAVRRGFFRRADVERLCAPCDCPPAARNARSWSARRRERQPDVRPCWHLPDVVADVVLFLFFCPWRVGAARGLEWRDFSAADGSLTLRHELNKDRRHELKIPVDAESTPELTAVVERQWRRRRPSCPSIFHGPSCGGPPRVYNKGHKAGQRRPCLGDFQKVWDRACEAIGMAGRIPHDLRRSGVKHYIDAGVDPHTVMGWSGHRTESMLRRYHIIDLDDLRRAGKRASDYRGPASNVRTLSERNGARAASEGTIAEPLQGYGNSRPAAEPQLS